MAQYSEEKMQILKMIEEGKITSAEGLELLNALGEETTFTEAAKTSKTKWLRVRVLAEDGKTKVNVNIPIALVDVALKMGARFAPELKDAGLENLDLDAIGEAIKSGAEGKIVDIYDEVEKTTVEVYVE